MRILIAAFIVGESFSLFFRNFVGLSVTFYLGIAIIFFCIAGGCFYIQSWSGRLLIWQNWHFSLIGLAIVCCSFGYVWTEYLKGHKDLTILNEEFDGKSVMLTGYIDGLPRIGKSSIQFTFHIELVDGVNKPSSFPERVSLTWFLRDSDLWKKEESIASQNDAGVKTVFTPGQQWKFKAKVNRPRGLLNPHGFNVERWMYVQNLGASGFIQVNSAELLSNWTWEFTPIVERVRYGIREKIMNSLGADAPYVGVMSALVMGDQAAIAQEDWRVFNATGIGHLISISGLHVTMLAGFGAWVTNRLWRYKNLPLIIPAQKVKVIGGLLTALIYTFLAGFQIPAQRTMFMVGSLAIALWIKRIIAPFDMWWWALGAVLFLDPWAVYTPGFWLSFGAVAAILFAMPTEHYGKVPDLDLIFIQKLKNSLGQACRVQAVVTIALIPMTLWWFYQISLISPFANAIAIPVVSFIVTPLAMVGAVLPWYFGDISLWLAHTSFSALAWAIRTMASLDWSIVHGAKPNLLMLCVSIFGVIVVIRPGKILPTWKSRLFGLLLCLSLFIPKNWFSVFAVGVPYGELEMTAWDIGQGTAVLIQTRNHVLLYDTGPLSLGNFDPGQRIIMPHLHAEGIDKIDRLAISHKDSDHVGGVKSILREFKVSDALGSIPAGHELHQEFRNNKVSIKPCQAGYRWHWDGVDFIVWHPHQQVTFESKYHLGKPNDMSCVIEVRNLYHSIWLTGDIERQAEQDIANRIIDHQSALKQIRQRKVTLMAPHHGSKTSSTESFIDSLDPQFVFSQSGYRNRYRHPNIEVVNRYQLRGNWLLDTSVTGAQIWKTQRSEMDFQWFRK